MHMNAQTCPAQFSSSTSRHLSRYVSLSSTRLVLHCICCSRKERDPECVHSTNKTEKKQTRRSQALVAFSAEQCARNTTDNALTFIVISLLQSIFLNSILSRAALLVRSARPLNYVLCVSDLTYWFEHCESTQKRNIRSTNCYNEAPCLPVADDGIRSELRLDACR